MKFQVRKNVFETNSSSMHSLVITKNDEHYTKEEMLRSLYIHDNGIIRYWEHELIFERTPFRCLSTFDGKLRYSIGAFCGYSGDADEKFKEIQSLVQEIIPECKGIELDDSYDDYGNPCKLYGYSQDYGMLGKFLKEKGITLKEFLTNRKYIVIVDGDEYCIWGGLKDSGLIDLTKIEDEYDGIEY